MELANVFVFIAEDSDSTLAEIKRIDLAKDLKSDIELEFSVPCEAELFESIKEIQPQIEERFHETHDSGKLFLSVGVFDLADSSRKPKGNFGIPKIARKALERELIPLFKKYHFRLVFITNVFNYCDAKFKYFIKWPTTARKFAFLEKYLKLIIKTNIESCISEKKPNPKAPFGEGFLNEEVIADIKTKLYDLIRKEIEYSKSPDSMYRKQKR